MHAFLPPVPRHVEALRAMLSCHGNHRDQLLEETSAWEEDISWAFRVLKTFRAGTPRGHSLMIFGQKGEVGWLSWRSSSPRNFRARISVGPGPLGSVVSVLPLGRPSSLLEHGTPRIGASPESPRLPQPRTAARQGFSPPETGFETCSAALAGVSDLAE